MRQLGWLQVWELQAWDVLTILRPREPMDDRFLIITVTPEDVQNQNAEERRAASLSDQALEQLLQKINQYNPRVIGLDLYRDFPLDDPETTPELLMQLTSNDTLVSVCQLAAHGSEEGIPAPPEIPKTDPSTRLGFSDVVVDELLDGPLRRQLLVASPDDACPALLSFNLLVALHYLDREGHQLSWGEEGDVPWQVSIGDVTFPSLQPNSGSYQRLDTAGSQIFLNYRSVGDPKNIAKTLTVADVLEHGRLTAADVADRIVLIGSADPLISYDAHFTPYSQTSLPDIPGVFLQAHMISQLVSAVLDDRPILTAGSEGQEIAWISLWSIVGIGWAGWAKSRLLLGLGIGILGLSLGLCCYGFLILGWWIPSVPALLGLSIGSGLMVLYRLKG
jgi:CHASE2 domain-containing sensor protein